MNKEDIYALFAEKGIEYEKAEHIAVFTIEEMLACSLPHTETIAKNLFLRDDKNREFYLVTRKEDARVNMKELQREIGSRRLSFAKAEQLSDILGLYRGAVTPLGLLNDGENRVHFILDAAYGDDDLIGCHPLDNTRTVYIKIGDLLKLIDGECADITRVKFEKTAKE